MKKLFYITFVLLIMAAMLFTACDLSFLDDDDDDGEEESVPSNYWDYNSDEDINYYYSGEDDSLISFAEYNYNADGKCIQITTYMKAGDDDPVTGASTFEWDDEGRLVARINWNFNLEPVYSWLMSYDVDGNVTAKTEYEITGEEDAWDFTASSQQTWEYSIDEDIVRTDYYEDADGSGTLTWTRAYQYEWEAGTADPSDRFIILSSRYGDSNARTAYIEYEYDSDDALLRKVGFGSSSSSDNYYGTFSSVSPGRSSDAAHSHGTLLANPDLPELPTVTEPVLTDDTASYSWMYMTDGLVYEGFGGEAEVYLNSDYMPVTLATDITGLDEIDETVTVEIDYERTYYPVEKRTYYGNEEILKLELDYDDDTDFLTDIDVSGEAMLTSIQCHIDYHSSNIPEAITLGLAGVDSVKFEYVYPETVFDSLTDPLAFLESVQTINQYTIHDGVPSLFATYTLEYNNDNTALTMTVTDGDGESTGKFVLYYDADGLLAGIKSFDADDNTVWDYDYTYDELENRVSELKLVVDVDISEFEIPEIFNTFDVESLLGDLDRYMPSYFDDFIDEIPDDLL